MLNKADTEKLISFIREQLIRQPNFEIKNDTPLLSSGLINSMSSVDLALYIEETFGIEVPDYAVTSQYMDTVEKIVGFINKLNQESF